MSPPAEILCPHCNAPNPKGITVCIACGTSLSDDAAASSTLVAPLVGRDNVLASVLKELETVRTQKRGRFVVIEGEGGIGKSRLSRELVARLWQGDQLSITGRAYADKQGASYWLLIDILSHLFRFEPEMDTEQKRQMVMEGLQRFLGADATGRTAPPFLWVLDIATESERQEMETLPPEQRQQRLFRGLQALLLMAGEKQPLVLLVDDAQWIDAASADGLAQILGKRMMMRMLVIAFSRPLFNEEDRPFARLLAASPPDTVYPLQPLTDEEARSLLAGLLNWSRAPQTLEELVLGRAQGQPFIIEELTRSLVERGILTFEEGQWHFNDKAGVAASLLPLTVRDTVQERLGRLSKVAHGLLDVAAIIGTRLEREVLVGAARRLGFDWNEKEIDEALTALVKRDFLLGEEANRFRFRHNLVQETVVYGLDDPQQRRIHLAIAQALELTYQTQLPFIVDRLALHYGQSDDAERAIHYLTQAGTQAVQHFASEQAIQFFRTALDRFPEQVAVHPDLFLAYGDLLSLLGRYDDARTIYNRGLNVTEPVHAVRFHCQLGTTYSRQAEYEQAEQSFYQALKQLTPKDKKMRARVYSEIAWVRFHQGQLDQADELYEQALALLNLSEHEARAQVLNRRAGVAFRKQDLDQAHKLLLRAMDPLSEVGDMLGMARAADNLGTIYQEWGDFQNGLQQRQQALALFERIGYREGLCATLVNLATLYQILGLFNESLGYAERCLELSREIGQKYLESWALDLLGWAQVNLGKSDAGIKTLGQGQEISQAIGSQDAYFESKLHELEARLGGDATEKREEELQTLIKHPEAAKWPGDLKRLEAIISRKKGNLEEGLRLIQSSLELLDQRRLPFRYLLSEVEQIMIQRELGQDVTSAQSQALLKWQRVVQVNTLPPPSVSSKLLGIIG